MPDSDEGSLSSGCESSGSTTASDMEPMFDTIQEEPKTDLDFKVGESVLSRVRSFEKLSNPDILHYCSAYRGRKPFLDHEEISLVPVGETQSDFSSLKVYKRRNSLDPVVGSSTERRSSEDDGNGSDESGYEEEELVSSVANIVLV